MRTIILKILLVAFVCMAAAISLALLYQHGSVSPRLLGIGLAIDGLGVWAASVFIFTKARTRPRNESVNPSPLERTVSISRLMLVCCYLAGVLFPLIYLTSEPYKRDSVIRFHSFQSITLFVLLLAVKLISLLSPLALRVAGIIEFVLFLTWLVLVIATYRGKTIKLPLIGKIAEQKAGWGEE